MERWWNFATQAGGGMGSLRGLGSYRVHIKEFCIINLDSGGLYPRPVPAPIRRHMLPEKWKKTKKTHTWKKKKYRNGWPNTVTVVLSIYFRTLIFFIWSINDTAMSAASFTVNLDNDDAPASGNRLTSSQLFSCIIDLVGSVMPREIDSLA